MDNSNQFYGPNAGYVLELYELYLADPEALDAETRRFFETWTPPEIEPPSAMAGVALVPSIDVRLIGAASSYAGFIRRYGHLAAELSPLHSDDREMPDELLPETYGLTEADLAAMPGDVITGAVARETANALDATKRLLSIYTGVVGYEFHHIQDKAERDWLYEATESGRYLTPLNADQKRALLRRMTEVEGFEQFLHTAYLGQKRFSIEGIDALVPMLEEMIHNASVNGIQGVIIGMAHRGRLNVLTHVLGKPYSAMIAEFEHVPRPGFGLPDVSDPGYSGDVKYHLGWRKIDGGEDSIPVLLAPNPSHLEYVDPVAEGLTRARQDRRDGPGEPEQDLNAALPIILHGDASFPGQGIVAETLNLARLRGFNTGGTLHIITNNQIGFTTDPSDARSTLYASDLAKGFEIPVVHVNADDPEAAIGVAHMALDYRNRFNRDFLIDLVGYRRWGHNESDEPSFTQPEMYQTVSSHPSARAILAEQLEHDRIIASGEGARMLDAQVDGLMDLRIQVREEALSSNGGSDNQLREPLTTTVDTEVSADVLLSCHDWLHSFPEEFTLNTKLSRQLQRRRGALEAEGGIDWALAESLAFASILADGVPIRMTGQDVERGTFSHRHLVLHDPTTHSTLTLLQQLPEARASFVVYNSPLSEAAVLGFEYGYSVAAPEALVLWEAQFGDFANSAQVIIDQFIASASAKWLQDSALVLLLPHGYEGQGPEHSSARLERFLQLAANNNVRVVNLSTSAQYFHVLRRQSKLLKLDPRPLIVMSPKSLLRHPMAGTSLEDLVAGSFQPVIDDETATGRRELVTRVVLCSGKVYVNLATSKDFGETKSVAVVRVEELYPLASARLQEIFHSYPNIAEVVWVQEEPHNMGAWTYMEPRLRALVAPDMPVRYIGRGEEASPAEGSLEDHQEIQSRIVNAAFATARTVQVSAADD